MGTPHYRGVVESGVWVSRDRRGTPERVLEDMWEEILHPGTESPQNRLKTAKESEFRTPPGIAIPKILLSLQVNPYPVSGICLPILLQISSDLGE